jgi:AraC-like DNA-binding protein
MKSTNHGVYDRFDTPALASGDRFEYWRDWLSQPTDVPMTLEPVRRLPYDFDASAEILSVGNVSVYEYRFGAGIGSWTRQAAATAERLRLMLIAPTPAATGQCHGQEISLARGAALLLGRTDGRLQTQKGLRAIQVNVPRQAIPVTDAQLASFNDQRRLQTDPVFTGLVRPALLGLRGHLDELTTTELPELGQLWISLLSMLTRSLAGHDTNGTDATLARRLQIQQHIDTHLADPRLSAATIANALHISRSTLYAALPAENDGIAAEIRRQRLAHAHTILIDPTNSQSIAEIAASVGMPNAAQFSRAFRQRYGLPPRQIKADHRSPPPPR